MYLEVIIRESRRFSFNLQGYGSFELAKAGLLKSNASDLAGYAFVNDSVPNIGSQEFNHMMEFLNLCNLMGRKKFVIVTRSALQGKFASVLKRFEILDFYAASGNEYITDSIISTNVFGSLLMTVKQPYKLKPEEKQSLKEFTCPTVQLVPAVNYFLLQCLEPISKLESIEQTSEYDTIYQDYLKTKTILAELRKARIMHVHKQYDEELMQVIYRKIEDGVRLGKMPTSYLVLFQLVLEEVNNEKFKSKIK